MTPLPSKMMIIFPPLSQAVSIMPENTITSTESNIIWTALTTTAARIVALTRM